ncbi:hypothetical protein TIFTF001_035568 [Ficus carica]|uniref:Transposase (putative) gypsy type domain-containing protein n=1 Tax=Ficus carica TaxID=3494 RepID=A0AA88E2P7_FICCA|nr:hypothetical protein TIFTF001_035544 [Ficus carica]GMN66490.1 hypothetical protein TIFTF001_035549 [Ficus carica]GMN66495.1 hypothetical protein TIFTF001_035562 [Ficus carica]GMN66510.1 hypothetical protein TIFTF001_035568 [Ficus carica]
MDKQKEIIDDVDVEWTSTDLSDSSSDNEELLSTIRCSRLEHEFQQSQMGAGTSEASERSRPATTSGEEFVSIPPIARLTEPPRRLTTETYLRTSNPRSILTENDLSDIRGRYGFPNEVQLRLPFKGERADTVSEGWICMYTIYFECGLRIPLPPLLIRAMNHYNLAIPQLMPNGMRVFLGLIVLSEKANIDLQVDDVLAIYYPQENSKDHGRYSMYPRRKKQVVGEMKNADRYWQDRYFFMHINKKSMGVLADAFNPFWGTLHKELKKPPPKALLFEKKLERLLALPDRDWDEIPVPRRLRASSLWKDFVELPSGIPKRVPSWVDWPFVIRGALRRLFGTPLFVDPLTDEEALIAKFALDSLVMEVPTPKDIMAKRKAKKEAERAAATAAAAASAGQVNEPEPFPVLESSPEPPSKPSSPPVQKRKVVEKPKRKIPVKRNKKSKVAIPETDVEGPRVEVDLPPSVSILHDRKTSVDIARQLFSDADAETMRQGLPQSHMDDIMWESMKINVRTMGLFYRMSDRVAEQRDQLKDLMAKDVARGEKLLDIERKFGDVKAGADGLMAELQKSMDVAREGTSAMETLVKRFDEGQAKIKSLEAENAALATQIMDAFEKATLKARYDILKDYKAGLLEEAQIDEEIEMFEEDYPDEARSLSAVPASVPVEAENANIEPPVPTNPSEDRDARE